MENLRKRWEESEKLAENYLSQLQRLQADFENYRKRSLKEREELIESASRDLVIKLLEVLDNMETAIECAKRSEDRESLITGVEMIYKQFREILEKEGLTPIKALGEAFDPFEHEAVERVSSPEHEDGTIVEEIQKGYKFKSKIIRPSKVKVVKNLSNT
jgi:molecular chaperone GrpE